MEPLVSPADGDENRRDRGRRHHGVRRSGPVAARANRRWTSVPGCCASDDRLVEIEAVQVGYVGRYRRARPLSSRLGRKPQALPVERPPKAEFDSIRLCSPTRRRRRPSHRARRAVQPPDGPTDMGGTGVIDRFLEVFTTYIDSGFGLLGGEVRFLAATCSRST